MGVPGVNLIKKAMGSAVTVTTATASKTACMAGSAGGAGVATMGEGLGMVGGGLVAAGSGVRNGLGKMGGGLMGNLKSGFSMGRSKSSEKD